MVMLGLSVANVVGVPAATWLGQHLGWRSAFWAVTGARAAHGRLVSSSCPRARRRRGHRAARAARVPRAAGVADPAGRRGRLRRHVRRLQLHRADRDRGGRPARGAVPVFLLAFGVGMVVGTWLAGELADWSVFRSLLLSALGMAVVLLAFSFVAPPAGGCCRSASWCRPRLRAGRQPPAAADGRRGRGPDPRRRAQPRLPQHRQRRRRLDRRPGDRGRVRLRSTGVVGAALAAAGFAVLLVAAAMQRRAPAVSRRHADRWGRTRLARSDYAAAPLVPIWTELVVIDLVRPRDRNRLGTFVLLIGVPLRTPSPRHPPWSFRMSSHQVSRRTLARGAAWTVPSWPSPSPRPRSPPRRP